MRMLDANRFENQITIIDPDDTNMEGATVDSLTRHLSADLVVRPGDGDAAAHTILEAQASAVPCVVMKGTSAAERVSPASAAACDSLSDFIVHTASLVRHADRRKAMSAAARAHALTQRWVTGLMPFYATYRSLAQPSLGRKLIGVVGEDRVNA